MQYMSSTSHSEIASSSSKKASSSNVSDKEENHKRQKPFVTRIAVLCANEGSIKNEKAKELLTKLKLMPTNQVEFDYIDQSRDVRKEVENGTVYDIVIDEYCPKQIGDLNLEESVLKFVSKKLVNGGRFLQTFGKRFPSSNFHRDMNSIPHQKWRVLVKDDSGFTKKAKKNNNIYATLIDAKKKELIRSLMATFSSGVVSKLFKNKTELKSSSLSFQTDTFIESTMKLAECGL